MFSTSKLCLPMPTYTLPDPSKKSHARRQPLGHIPRPRNAFILFRCDFVRQKKIPQAVEPDHRNISRIVGKIWREMSAFEKEPWVKMADAEKIQHLRSHPGYRFTRGNSNGKRRCRRGDEGVSPFAKDDLASISISDDDALLDLDRAASCPVGALRVPNVTVEFAHGYGNPMKTRDDLERRPSRVTLYQSTSNDLQAVSSSDSFADFANQYYYYSTTVNERQDAVKRETDAVEYQTTKEDSCDEDGELEGKFCGPRMDAMKYPVPGLDTPMFPWEGNSGSWASSFTSGPVKNERLAQHHTAPVFTDPFNLSATLPPLPRTTLPFPLDVDYNDYLIPERKMSNFRPPGSAHWRLPTPVRQTAAVFESRKPSFVGFPEKIQVSKDAAFFHNQPAISSLEPMDFKTMAASKHAHNAAEELLQDFSRTYLSDLTMGDKDAYPSEIFS